MIKHLLKKILAFASLFVFTSIAAGCGALSGHITYAQLSYYTDGLPSTLQDVIDRNNKYIDELVTNGYITSDYGETLKANSSSRMKRYVQILQQIQDPSNTPNTQNGNGKQNTDPNSVDPNTPVSSDFINAITIYSQSSLTSNQYCIDGATMAQTSGHGNISDNGSKQGIYTVEWDPSATHPDDEEDCQSLYGSKTNLILIHMQAVGDKNTGKSGINSTGKTVSFKVFDTGVMKELQSKLSRKVRVINKFDSNHTPEQLQVIISLLNNDYANAKKLAEENGVLMERPFNSSKNFAQLINEFSINKDTTNNIQDLENTLAGYTTVLDKPFINVQSYKESDIGDGTSAPNRVDDQSIPYMFADSEAQQISYGDEAGSSNSYNNELGKDVVIMANGSPALSLKVAEFNPDLITELKKAEDEQKKNLKGSFYIMQSDSQRDYIVKLDYPLYKIHTIKTDSVSSKNWNTEIADTGLRMDLKNGSLYDSDGMAVPYTTPIYTTASIEFYNKDDKDVEVSYTSASQDTIKVRPLVLKDYVETYRIVTDEGKSIMPNGEKFLALGRRMHIQRLRGKTDKDIAEFAYSLNADGSIPEDKNYIPLSAICDRTSGYGFYENTAEKLGLGNKNSDATQKILDDSSNRSGENNFMALSQSDASINNRVDPTKFYAVTYWDNINPVMCLGETNNESDPSSATVKLASKDHDRVYNKTASNAYGAPTVYAMCIADGINDCHLIGGTWLADTAESSTDMQNWNTWLAKNNLRYQIPIDEILKLFGLKLMSGSDKKESVVFNTDTVEAIQKQQNIEEENFIEATINTIAKVIGILVMSYAMLLPAAWLIDTNVYGSFSLLEKLTFGHWISVQDMTDVPTNSSTDGPQYMGIAGIVKGVWTLMLAGAFLILVNVTDIIPIVKNFVGPLISKLVYILTGQNV